jgi:hypothetical protein
MNINYKAHVYVIFSIFPFLSIGFKYSLVHHFPHHSGLGSTPGRSCGFYGGQSGRGRAFYEYFAFPYRYLFHPLLHIHYYPITGRYIQVFSLSVFMKTCLSIGTSYCFKLILNIGPLCYFWMHQHKHRPIGGVFS